MSAGTIPRLTLEEFDRIYGSENGWEFWFGEAVRKPVPNWYHAILQFVLVDLLFRAGYIAGGEVSLKVAAEWQPRPDVMAVRNLRSEYPMEASAVDAVFEILSDDQMSSLLTKCDHYARIGIRDIWVLDPGGRRIWQWNPEMKDLERSRDIQLNNGHTLRFEDIWDEFERRVTLPAAASE